MWVGLIESAEDLNGKTWVPEKEVHPQTPDVTSLANTRQVAWSLDKLTMIFRKMSLNPLLCSYHSLPPPSSFPNTHTLLYMLTSTHSHAHT